MTPAIKNLREEIVTAKKQLKEAESNLDFRLADIINERIKKHQKALRERIKRATMQA